MQGKNARQSFRIQETAYVSFELLTDEEFDGGIERWRIRNGGDAGTHARMMDIDARLKEQLFLLQASNAKASECIDLLREKLDIIVEQLPEFRDCKNSLAQTEPQLCNISADGMAFDAAEPLPIDTRLALRMLLETDSRYIESFCRVVRVSESASGPDSPLPVRIAVEFLGMPPAQREILIQHLFSREAETLRIKRLHMD